MDICLDTNTLSRLTPNDFQLIKQAVERLGYRIVVSQKIITEIIDGNSAAGVRSRIKICFNLMNLIGNNFLLARENNEILQMESKGEAFQGTPCLSIEETRHVINELEKMSQSDDATFLSEMAKFSARSGKVKNQAAVAAVATEIGAELLSGKYPLDDVESLYSLIEQANGLGQLYYRFDFISDRLCDAYGVPHASVDPVKHRCLTVHAAYFVRNILAQNAEAALQFLQSAGSARTKFADILGYHENDEYDATIAATYAYSSIVVSNDQVFLLVLQKIIDDFLSDQGFVPPTIMTPDGFRSFLKQQLA